MFSFIPLNAIRECSSLLTAELEVDTSGRLRADRAMAAAELAAARASLELSERDLKRAVTAAYLRVLLARRLAGVIGDSLAEAQDFSRRVQLLSEHGEASRADVFKARAAAAFLEQRLALAELDARLAAQELASFWTVEVDEPFELDDLLSKPVPAPQGLRSRQAVPAPPGIQASGS